jgi:hypothetical protein
MRQTIDFASEGAGIVRLAEPICVVRALRQPVGKGMTVPGPQADLPETSTSEAKRTFKFRKEVGGGQISRWFRLRTGGSGSGVQS